ncbi:hypothetical protein Z948_2647 [Sulfitobacter donghicola DSW-25 = KCTC 12864 = JCM 14565]|nr:hypothetical protein Z948_2647 [Sulfitobacter donghicola DSW-25 = KCTC 12864 = JCM 14565]
MLRYFKRSMPRSEMSRSKPRTPHTAGHGYLARPAPNDG